MTEKYRSSFSRTALLTVVSICTALATSAVFADDTEIYTGQVDPAMIGPSNVLFIVDTSGSMNSQVAVAADYDPEIVYLDGNGDGTPDSGCALDRIYWRYIGVGDTSFPSCNSINYIYNSALHCQAGRTSIDSVGYYLDEMVYLTIEDGNPDLPPPAEWDLDWLPLQYVRYLPGGPLDQHDLPIECHADHGVHGPNSQPGLIYPINDAVLAGWNETDSWTADPANPNIVSWSDDGFHGLYSANYLNYLKFIEDSGQIAVKSRLEVVQDTLNELLLANQGLDINVGLMRFDIAHGEPGGPRGGPVRYPVTPLTDAVGDITAELSSFEPTGSTPLAETMYEAMLYYSGQAPEFGDESDPPNHPDAVGVDGNYISPIEFECQSNYVVLLTDGLPTADNEADLLIAGLPGVGPCTENCLDEISQYMSNADFDGSLNDTQDVDTFTIGFFVDNVILKDSATAFDDDADPDNNDDDYFQVTDTAGLTAALQEVLLEISAPSGTNVSPAIAINNFDRFFSFEDIFITLFKPSGIGEPHWDGNLKKYKLQIVDNKVVIVGANGEMAINENGQFEPGAQSFWSTGPDGDDITLGGFAQNLKPPALVGLEERLIYTNLVADNSGVYNLNIGENRVRVDNALITRDMVNAGSDEEREDLIYWAHALDENGEIPVDENGVEKRFIGDPLHSRPVVAAYDVNGNEEDPDIIVYFGTNDGFLHAVDPNEFAPGGGGNLDDEGLELFAFIPQPQLHDLKTLRDNVPRDPSSAFKEYGIDGPMTLWIDEENDNNVIETAENEKAYLIVGMGRGGRNYYVLDVTNRLTPKLVWIIEGGRGSFRQLGQTWSAPMVTKIRTENDGDRTVVMFGGGYDTNQDAKDQRNEQPEDSIGNAIYMIDVETHELLWQATDSGLGDLQIPEMTHSIPSDLRMLDLNRDGYVDRIYVGDTSAKLFRFDVDNFDFNADGLPTITGGMIFDASDGGPQDQMGGDFNNRKMYYPPSVARVIDETYGSFLAVSFTTGTRGHPLEEDVQDRAYSFRDYYVFGPPPPAVANGDPDYSQIVNGDLVNITDDLDPDPALLRDAPGWYFDLVGDEEKETGEKGLSSPVVFDNVLYFTTYQPLPQDLNCSPLLANQKNRLYAIDLINGRPAYNTGLIDDPDLRYSVIGIGGIPPAPVFAFLECEGDECHPLDDQGNVDPLPGCDSPVSRVTMLVGTQVEDPRVCNIPERTYWYQEGIGSN